MITHSSIHSLIAEIKRARRRRIENIIVGFIIGFTITTIIIFSLSCGRSVL